MIEFKSPVFVHTLRSSDHNFKRFKTIISINLSDQLVDQLNLILKLLI